MAARAKLAQKFDAVRTGGKGTTRRQGSPALTGGLVIREKPKKRLVTSGEKLWFWLIDHDFFGIFREKPKFVERCWILRSKDGETSGQLCRWEATPGPFEAIGPQQHPRRTGLAGAFRSLGRWVFGGLGASHQPGSGQALRRWTCSLKMAACCLVQKPLLVDGLMTIEIFIPLLWRVLPSHLHFFFK